MQLMGEDKAFDYLKALHKNVSQYTKSGAAPARAAAKRAWSVSRSSTTPSYGRSAGPVTIVSPCEGAATRSGHEHHQGREEHGPPRSGTTGR
jgi:iron(III) transport system substrate-binding protein